MQPPLHESLLSYENMRYGDDCSEVGSVLHSSTTSTQGSAPFECLQPAPRTKSPIPSYAELSGDILYEQAVVLCEQYYEMLGHAYGYGMIDKDNYDRIKQYYTLGAMIEPYTYDITSYEYDDEGRRYCQKLCEAIDDLDDRLCTVKRSCSR